MRSNGGRGLARCALPRSAEIGSGLDMISTSRHHAAAQKLPSMGMWPGPDYRRWAESRREGTARRLSRAGDRGARLNLAGAVGETLRTVSARAFLRSDRFARHNHGSAAKHLSHWRPENLLRLRIRVP